MKVDERDFSWASLPKVFRDRIKFEYSKTSSLPRKGAYELGKLHAFEYIFGINNLQSDTEPEELLFCSKKKVKEMYPHFNNHNTFNRGVIYAFKSLFGDKCMPDKEEKAKPFREGDKVRVIDFDRSMSSLFFFKNKICRVKGITSDGGYKLELIYDFDKNIRVNEYDTAEEFLKSIQWDESFLELYTEQPKPFREGDKVKFKDTYYKEELHGKTGIITLLNVDCYVKLDNTIYLARMCDLEPYTEEKNDMEEKELDLVKMLKDSIGEEFYSLTNGNVILKRIDNAESVGKVIKIGDGYCEIHVNILPNGKVTPEGDCILFPSRELYEKYPLDAKKAWQIWSEERKPKRWRAEEGERYWFFSGNLDIDCEDEKGVLSDDLRYECGYYFRTGSDAKEVAEGIKQYLEYFHNRKESKQ